MLKEIISFVDTFDQSESKLPEKDWSDAKLIVIKTKGNNTLEYDGLEILDDVSKINNWCKKNKHYEEIIKKFNDYTEPLPNKGLGSKGGLQTYSFFAFKLPIKNLSNLKQKIKKTKFAKEQHKELIKSIHSILLEAKTDLQIKDKDKFLYENYSVLIYTNKQNFKNWEKITNDFIKSRTSSLNTTSKLETRNCYACNKKEVKVGASIFQTTYQSKKIFLKHITRYTEGKKLSCKLCEDCNSKLDKFNKILKKYGIKILPLFVKPNEINEEIISLDSDGKNTFYHIFDSVQKKQDKNTFDFFLVVQSKDYFLADYIKNYKWKIGKYVDFFKKDDHPYDITRSGIEQKLAKVLAASEQKQNSSEFSSGGIEQKLAKDRIDYFVKLKGYDNQQATVIYSFRQKIFDFVYRNQNTISLTDLRNIILFRIEREIKNSNRNPDRYQESLNLFFNRNLLVQQPDNQKTSFEDNIKKTISDVQVMIDENNLESFEIKDDDTWAFFAGQLAYYLVYQSKTKNKNYGLLEPFTNKTTTALVKETIHQMFERYKHEISLSAKRFNVISGKVLSYDIDDSFIKFKLPFYVGVFSENLIFYKKKGNDK